MCDAVQILTGIVLISTYLHIYSQTRALTYAHVSCFDASTHTHLRACVPTRTCTGTCLPNADTQTLGGTWP